MWIIETKTEPTTAVITISLGNSTVAIVTAFIASLEYDKPPTTAKIIAAKIPSMVTYSFCDLSSFLFTTLYFFFSSLV